MPSRLPTLRYAYLHETAELADVRAQLGGLAATIQALPAVGALVLALFGTLAASPAYARIEPTVLLAVGVLPFLALVIVAGREFGRAPTAVSAQALTQADDERALEEWFVLRIAEQRLEQAVLNQLVDRKRGRLRIASAFLAIQVGYVFIVVIAVALVWPQTQ